jgi:hypothetical protein
MTGSKRAGVGASVFGYIAMIIIMQWRAVMKRRIPARTTRSRRRNRRLDWRSFLLGAASVVLIVVFTARADAFDLKNVGDLGGKIVATVKSLTSLKGKLDGDVKNLTGDAKTLVGDKDKILAIKNQLVQLATQTKQQIDSISATVQEVEGHLATTGAHIKETAGHVKEIDTIKEVLK